MIGTSVAPYRRISGGVMFGGIVFSTTCALLVNCDTARLTSAPGCRYTLMTPTPV